MTLAMAPLPTPATKAEYKRFISLSNGALGVVNGGVLVVVVVFVVTTDDAEGAALVASVMVVLSFLAV